MTIRTFRSVRHIACAVSAAAALTACGGGGSDSGSQPTTRSTASLRFAAKTPPPRAMALSALSADTLARAAAVGPTLTITDGTNTLVIDKVSLTLRDIDMERTSQSVDCDGNSNSSSADCSDWVDGPLRVDLNLGDLSKGLELSIPLQVGTYDVISFDMSVPDGGDAEERAYIAAHPDIGNNSVLVTGTFNGEPFSYKSRVTGDREVVLNPPLEVKADGSTNFRFGIDFDIGLWFKRSNGNLIDPRTTVASEQETIRQNIRDRVESYSRP